MDRVARSKLGHYPDLQRMEENAAMPSEAPDLRALSERLDLILERLSKLEVQVLGLVTSQTMEGKKFVVRDDRGEVWARLGMQEYAPCLVFLDRSGKERLRIGLRTDGTPATWVEGRETPLEK